MEAVYIIALPNNTASVASVALNIIFGSASINVEHYYVDYKIMYVKIP